MILGTSEQEIELIASGFTTIYFLLFNVFNVEWENELWSKVRFLVGTGSRAKKQVGLQR